MRTIKEFLDNKYAEKEMGEKFFDIAVTDIAQYLLTKHTTENGLDNEIVDNVGPTFRDGNALIIEGAMGATSMGAAILGGGAVAFGSEETMLQSLAIGGATTTAIMLMLIVKDKMSYKKSKAQLKNWVKEEISSGDYVMPEMSDRTKDACLGEVCEYLADEFVMQMK